MSDVDDASARRTFLEVTLPNTETTKLLQLDSHVKFKNVLKMIKMPPGRLLFDDGFIVDPLDTPLSLGLPTGVDSVVQVEYVLDDDYSPASNQATGSQFPDVPSVTQQVPADGSSTAGYVSGAELFGNDAKTGYQSQSRTQPAESRLHSLASTSRPVPSPSVPAEARQSQSQVRISPSRDGDGAQAQWDAPPAPEVATATQPLESVKNPRTPSQGSEAAPSERALVQHQPNGRMAPAISIGNVKEEAENRDLSPQTPVLREVRRERVHRAPVLAPGVDGPGHAAHKSESKSPEGHASMQEQRRNQPLSTNGVRGGTLVVGAPSPAQRAGSAHSSLSASMPSEHGRRMYQQLMRNSSVGPPGSVNSSDAPGANMPLSARGPQSRCALPQTHALKDNAELIPWPAQSSFIKKASGNQQSMALLYGPAQPLPPPLPKSQAHLQRDLSKSDSRPQPGTSTKSSGESQRPSTAVGAAAAQTATSPPPPQLPAAGIPTDAPKPSPPAATTNNNYYHYYYGAQSGPSQERGSFSHPGNSSAYFASSTQPAPAQPHLQHYQQQQSRMNDIVTPIRPQTDASFQGNTPSAITPGTDMLDLQALKAAAAVGNGQLTLLASPPRSTRDHQNLTATQGFTTDQLAPFAKEVDDIRHGLAKEKQQRRELSRRVQALVESVSSSSNRIEIGALAQQLHASQMERLREQRRRARAQSASASSTPRRVN